MQDKRLPYTNLPYCRSSSCTATSQAVSPPACRILVSPSPLVRMSASFFQPIHPPLRWSALSSEQRKSSPTDSHPKLRHTIPPWFHTANHQTIQRHSKPSKYLPRQPATPPPPQQRQHENTTSRTPHGRRMFRNPPSRRISRPHRAH